MDREKVITGLTMLVDIKNDDTCEGLKCCKIAEDALALLAEQEAEIRQLRLALDIAKGTCKGIRSGGDQFADMPTMQSAT